MMSSHLLTPKKGNEKAHDLAKDGAMMKGGSMAQVQAIRIQQEREEVYEEQLFAARFHCLVED